MGLNASLNYSSALQPGPNKKIKLRNSRIQLPSRILAQQVMASPPSVTMTTSHTIATPLYWPVASYGGAVLSPIATAYSSVMGTVASYKNAANNPQRAIGSGASVNFGAGFSANVFKQAVLHTGSAIEIGVFGQTSWFVVKVDDQYISLTPQTVANDSGFYFYYIPFGSVKTRRVEFVGAGSCAVFGWYTAQTDSLEPAPVRGPRVIVVGDSFTERTIGFDESSVACMGYPQYLGDYLAWDDIWPSGLGSTGYLAAPAPKPTFRQRFLGDVAAYNPEMIIWAGGVNDLLSPAASVIAEAQACFALAASSCPNALQVALPPFRIKGPGAVGVVALQIEAGLQSAIQAVGGLYLPIYNSPLQTVPDTQTLQANVTAGASTFQTAAYPVVQGTYRFTDGTQCQVRSVSGTASPFTVTVDGVVTSHASGETLTQVGNSFLTGFGYVGGTTGWGSADRMVTTDQEHPTAYQRPVLANAIATQLLVAMAPN